MTTELQKIGIVGAGAMGRGIAQVCAAAGCTVQLFDLAPGAVDKAIGAVRQDLDQAVQRGKASAADVEATLARIAPAAALADLVACDLVVEAIVERMEVKKGLFRDLEAVVPSTCLLATNTSSLSVTELAAACKAPARVLGWHFFNPVPRMKVVEVIETPLSAPAAGQSLVALSRRIGHRPVVTSDSPGFVVNHAGRAFVTEGLKLLGERVAPVPVIDAIMRAAGFRMGPLELLDLTGLDVSVPVMESIHAQYYGDDRYRPSALARTRLLAGLLGRKSGRGFYDHGTTRTEVPEVAEVAEVVTGPMPGLWWPTDGAAALPASIANLLPRAGLSARPSKADLILVAPIGADLSSTVAELRLDPAKTVAVDPVFFGPAGCTLMVGPATTVAARRAAQAVFAALAMPVNLISDTAGFVAPRVIACIVNLACEMAQQGVATPQDIDAAVKLGLGYPLGPFEWGDKLGAKVVLEILRGLHEGFADPRYRPAPWLVRRARLGLPLATPDRAG